MDQLDEALFESDSNRLRHVPHQQLLPLVRPQGFLLSGSVPGNAWMRLGVAVIAVVWAAALLVGCTGSGSPPGTSVTSSPSRPTQDRIPVLTGLSRMDASRTLDQLGVAYFVVPAGPPLDDLVIRQKPPPGTSLTGLRQVLIFVHCQAAPCPSPAKGEVLYDPCSCATR